MTRTVNAYNVSSNELKIGDRMFFTVKLMITPMGYRIYRCDVGEEEGSRIEYKLEPAVMKALFPVVAWAKIKHDTR